MSLPQAHAFAVYDLRTVTIAKYVVLRVPPLESLTSSDSGHRRLPVFHDASDVDIARDDQSVLVSFNNAKVCIVMTFSASTHTSVKGATTTMES